MDSLGQYIMTRCLLIPFAYPTFDL